MKDKLLELIKQEDNKKPFTDSDLAELLNQRREVVTLLRKNLIYLILGNGVSLT